jgi:hypothetical protein
LSNPRLKFSLRIAGIAFCFGTGVWVGRIGSRDVQVRAQERTNLPAGCRVVVPRSWGEYRGASEYGLAFQDENGTVRFMLHPPCGSIDSTTDPSAIDLILQRR